MTDSELLLEVKSLRMVEQDRVILDDINLTLKSKEIIVIVGPNGGGKSSLIRIIAGVYSNYGGSVVKSDNLKTAYMPQFFTINNSLPLNVRDFILLKHHRRDNENNSISLSWVIEFLKLGKIMKCLMHELSGGEIKRVLLARCLMQSPDLLILDEPTESMDIKAQDEFYKIIAHAHKKLKCAILMASHDLYIVMKGTHRVLCLKNKICCEGNPDHIIRNQDLTQIFGKNVNLYQHKH